MAVDRDRVVSLVHELLCAVGEDPDRPGLTGTPERVADNYVEFFSGLDRDPAEPLAHPISVSAGPAPDTTPSGAVMLRDVAFRSVCEHHLLPFEGVAHLAYLPFDRVVGLGALPRVVDVLASRPQVQERLGEQIASTLESALHARGVLVILEAAHDCVVMRGARRTGSSTVTIAARGAFTEPAARSEIIMLMGGDRA